MRVRAGQGHAERGRTEQTALFFFFPLCPSLEEKENLSGVKHHDKLVFLVSPDKAITRLSGKEFFGIWRRGDFLCAFFELTNWLMRNR